MGRATTWLGVSAWNVHLSLNAAIPLRIVRFRCLGILKLKALLLCAKSSDSFHAKAVVSGSPHGR